MREKTGFLNQGERLKMDSFFVASFAKLAKLCFKLTHPTEDWVYGTLPFAPKFFYRNLFSPWYITRLTNYLTLSANFCYGK